MIPLFRKKTRHMPSAPLVIIKLALAFVLLLPTVHGDLVAEFRQGDARDSHLVRLPALFVEKGQPATPLLKSGSFEATWRGQLSLVKRQRLYFSFTGQGQVTLSINNEEVLSESGQLGQGKSERLRLNSGKHDILICYQSPEDGAARFQLLWEERSFPTEPIPSKSFTQLPAHSSASALAYRGRELFARHLCLKCHLPPEGFAKGAMPELGHVPPILALTGDRLKEDWIARWIAHPASFRPNTNMPRLVPDSAEGRQKAADLAAYLMTMKTGSTEPALEASASDGGALFHKLACITCHGLPNDSEPSEQRIPLTHLHDKFQAHALQDFLSEPAKLSPHTRMPNFHLEEKEAAALSRYLLEASAAVEKKPVVPVFPKGNANRGLDLSKQLQCGACHAGLPYDLKSLPTFEAIAQKPWTNATCFQSEASHLNLPPEAGEALEALRSQHLSSLQKDTPSSLAIRQLQALRCTACHTRDEQTSLLDSLHSQSANLASHLNKGGKLDQSLPLLTHTGEMLHTDYLTRILAGQASPRARPWLSARMPSFRNHSPSTFAAGLAAQHGLSPSQPLENKASTESLALGKELISSETGFGCTTCHGVGQQEATAAFEVKGIHFDLTKQRLRESFFYRWMHNPIRINASTKMPRYADDQGQTTLPLLDGDSRAQFEAIWNYLQAEHGE